jgi:hypothetical protein
VARQEFLLWRAWFTFIKGRSDAWHCNSNSTPKQTTVFCAMQSLASNRNIGYRVKDRASQGLASHTRIMGHCLSLVFMHAAFPWSFRRGQVFPTPRQLYQTTLHILRRVGQKQAFDENLLRLKRGLKNAYLLPSLHTTLERLWTHSEFLQRV